VFGRSGSLQLARLFGIRVGADYSWLLVLFLVIFFFQDQFRNTVGGSDTTIYLAAVCAAFLFFGSIIVHEMGHALAARREGIEVAGIDLFLFGGLMHMRSEPRTAGAEFRVAAAGPAATVLVIVAGTLAGVLLAGGWSSFMDAATFEAVDVSIALELVASIVVMNAFVLAFNLVPAYPLDGGRIARSAVWAVTGDRHRATRAAAWLGRAFAWLLIAAGLYLAAVEGQTFSGIYLAVLGWLLGNQARGAAAHTAFTQRLEGVTVADIMDVEPVAIPAALPAAQAFDEFFLRYHGYDWFAVTEADGRYVGRAYRDPVREAADGPNAGIPVRELAGADADGRVRDDVPLEALLTYEPLRRLGALMAVDADGRLRGVVTAEQVARALRSRLVAS
jgi:Zn-dependent protease